MRSLRALLDEVRSRGGRVTLRNGTPIVIGADLPTEILDELDLFRWVLARLLLVCWQVPAACGEQLVALVSDRMVLAENDWLPDAMETSHGLVDLVERELAAFGAHSVGRTVHALFDAEGRFDFAAVIAIEFLVKGRLEKHQLPLDDRHDAARSSTTPPGSTPGQP